jgi:hypothetical protein
VELAAELEASLREFATASSVEVRENGSRVASLAGLSWEVRGASGQPLLHLWSGQHNLTRRVLAITDHSEQRLVLAVECFGRTRPDRLEFVRTDLDHAARDLCREEFCRRLGRILAQRFPDETVESLTISPDLEHSLSGNYARGLLRHGSARWAVLAVPEGESPEVTENSLTFALLWLDRAGHSNRRGFVTGLRLIVPRGTTLAGVYRCRALDPKLRFEVYESDPARETLELIDGNSAGDLATRLVARSETQSLLDQARAALDPIMALAPKAITVHAVVESQEAWLRFRGVAFARWDEGKVFFGTSDAREELTVSSRAAFRDLLKDLEIHRNSLASDTRHSLYRAQPERWLESLVREDVTRIDAALDSRFVYAQVFANAGGGHGSLDLLGVTRTGRLAVLELKAAEHLHLPMQAAGYWLRVRRHLERGDFPRNGYFPGVQLQPAPPLVYLVAPLQRFHPTTDVLLRYLSSELEVVRVGLAESWRRGLRVVNRQ